MNRTKRPNHANAFEIESYGNGFAFLIVRKADGASAFLQGDDAREFTEQLERTCDYCTNDNVAELYFD
jgi:hypothetical protein